MPYRKRLILTYQIDFEEYAKLFDLESRLRSNSTVTKIHRLPESEPFRWEVHVLQGKDSKEEIQYRSKYLAVCTGFNRKPYFSPIPCMSDFKGGTVVTRNVTKADRVSDIIHSRWYVNGEAYKGKKVLIIGSGNSAIDQASDLSSYGVQVDVSMRTPRHFVSLETPSEVAVLAQSQLYKFRKTYNNNRYPLAGLLFLSEDLSKYKIGPADPKLLENPYYIPNFDQGFIDALKEGKINVIPHGVSSFTKEGVEFENGETSNYDTVIMATGYKTGLEDMFEEHEKYLDIQPPHANYGWLPKSDKEGQSVVDSSLFFAGYQPYMVGVFNGYEGFLTGEKISSTMNHQPFDVDQSFLLKSKKRTLIMWTSLLAIPAMSLAVFCCLRKVRAASMHNSNKFNRKWR